MNFYYLQIEAWFQISSTFEIKRLVRNAQQTNNHSQKLLGNKRNARTIHARTIQVLGKAHDTRFNICLSTDVAIVVEQMLNSLRVLLS